MLATPAQTRATAMRAIWLHWELAEARVEELAVPEPVALQPAAPVARELVALQPAAPA